MKWLGVLLAGGRSSRMGRDKRTLVWEGWTLLDRATLLLEEVIGVDKILISGDLPGKNSCPDLTPGLGPLGGLHSVLLNPMICDETWLLLVPVDMPLLSKATLKYLLELAAASVGTANDGVRFKDRELPAALRVSSKLKREVTRLFDAGVPARDRSFRNLWRSVDMFSVSSRPEWESSFKNINTPEELAEIQGGNFESSI